MRPLEGLLVLDFSTLLPGPMATLMLAEAGAKVIKIEPPGGDPMRAYDPRWGEAGAIFALLNRGKESLAVDLKSPQSREQVLNLVRQADVLVEQFRPGVMDRLGLGYAAASQANPRIVYCSITGFGQSGPRAMEAGHDLNYAGDTGYLALSMGDVSQAVLPATPIGDIGGGSYPAVINILLALEERRRTGRGQHVDVAMSENMFTFAYWALAAGFATGDWPADGGHLVTGSSPRYRVYATRDHQGLVVAALEPRFWATFCDAIGLAEALRDDARDPAATTREIARIVGSQDATFWAETVVVKDCCCSLVRGLADAVHDPHYRARGVFAAEVVNASGQRMPALPLPIAPAFREKASSPSRAPTLGSINHTLAAKPNP